MNIRKEVLPSDFATHPDKDPAQYDEQGRRYFHNAQTGSRVYPDNPEMDFSIGGHNRND